MNCPICNVALVISDRQGIEIDYCPKCRGIWLDRGELDKIIERSAQENPGSPYGSNQPFNQYGNDYDRNKHHGHGGYYKPHKQKNWLSDLFD
jgi:Zn-finger nucleic acid-binding protein